MSLVNVAPSGGCRAVTHKAGLPGYGKKSEVMTASNHTGLQSNCPLVAKYDAIVYILFMAGCKRQYYSWYPHDCTLRTACVGKENQNIHR